MAKHARGPYSKIIGPAKYCRLMTHQHRFISEADRLVRDLIESEEQRERAGRQSGQKLEVVEFGCGPARLLQLVATIAGVRVSGIDTDEGFLSYGRNILKQKGFKAKLRLENAKNYRHSRPIDVAYSQGLHHHVKGYLANVRDNLAADGCYILSDEFLADYDLGNEEARRRQSVLWHAYVIRSAQLDGFVKLAAEEAKTLLDDLSSEGDPEWVKTREQIDLALAAAPLIDGARARGETEQAQQAAARFLNELAPLRRTIPHPGNTFALNRGDFKQSLQALCQEAEAVGFEIEEIESFGPIRVAGGLSVLVLRKKL